MAPTTVREIETAIQRLTRREIEELYAWFEEHYPDPIDARIKDDLAAGKLDAAIDQALNDEKNGLTKRL